MVRIVLLAMVVAVLGPTETAWGAAGDVPSGVPEVEAAHAAFRGFAANLKTFAWIILLIGIVIGGIGWALFGQQKIAIGVLIGAVIIGGGSYLIGIIARGWT